MDKQLPPEWVVLCIQHSQRFPITVCWYCCGWHNWWTCKAYSSPKKEKRKMPRPGWVPVHDKEWRNLLGEDAAGQALAVEVQAGGPLSVSPCRCVWAKDTSVAEAMCLGCGDGPQTCAAQEAGMLSKSRVTSCSKAGCV